MVGTLRFDHPTMSNAWLRLLQRRGQILDQVVRVLKPRREADEALADAERGAVLRLEALMRRRCRMRDEALGVAEVVRDLGELELVEHAERRDRKSPRLNSSPH